MTTTALRELLRFKDLKAARICENHPRLKSLIDHEDFPPGIWTGPNSHCWFSDEVVDWLASRPQQRPPRKPRHKRGKDAAA